MRCGARWGCIDRPPRSLGAGATLGAGEVAFEAVASVGGEGIEAEAVAEAGAAVDHLAGEGEAVAAEVQHDVDAGAGGLEAG